MWEWDADVTPLPPPLDNGKSPMAKARRQLLTLHDDRENPFPKHVVPRDFVDFLGARTHVPASYAATAAVSAPAWAGNLRWSALVFYTSTPLHP